MRGTHSLNTQSGLMVHRSITVTTMTDGDPFNPRYGSLPADPELTLEEATLLAKKLFGGRHTTVEETVVSRRVEEPLP